jgi:ubiquinone/menaquinone biosynthesis C-methylase UbiE
MEIFEKLEEKEDQLILAFLATILDKNNIRSICDYGCGGGRIIKLLKDKYPNTIKFTGIDFWSSEFSNKEMPENEEQINFIDNGSLNIGKFIEANCFDIVFSSYALHHFRLPIKELKRMESLISPNGFLILFDIYKDYTDEKTVADNVFFCHSQMMMAMRGSYHRIPYTKDEISDLLLALDMKFTEQRILELKLTDKELEQYADAVPVWMKEVAEKKLKEDELKNVHPDIINVFKYSRKFTAELMKRHGSKPDNLLVTAAKK